MATKKTTKKQRTRRQVRAVVRRQVADEMVDFRLVVVCPGCGRRDCSRIGCLESW